MFVYKEVTSNDTIISSTSIVTFLIELENVVEFLGSFIKQEASGKSSDNE